MLSSAKATSFLVVSDAEKARHFYRDLLGLPLVADEPHELIFDSNGLLLHVMPVPEPAIAPHTVFGWQVTDIRAEVDELVAKGITFERYDFMEQDERAICTFPDGDQFAWFKDPDGNTLSLAQLSMSKGA